MSQKAVGGRMGQGNADLNEGLRQASRVNDFEKTKKLIKSNADVNSAYVRLPHKCNTPFLRVFICTWVSADRIPRSLADRLYPNSMGFDVRPQGGHRRPARE